MWAEAGSEKEKYRTWGCGLLAVQEKGSQFQVKEEA